MSLKPQRENAEKLDVSKKSFSFSFSLFYIYFIAVPLLCVLWVYSPSFSPQCHNNIRREEKCCRKKKLSEIK